MHDETRGTAAAGGGKAARAAISSGRLPAVALLAALAAAVVNAGIYFAALGLGLIPEDLPVPTPGGEQPLTVVPVVVGSATGAIGAAVVFAVIGLFSRRPVGLFRIVSVAALVLSFASPLTIPGAPLSMVLSLEAMHVAAWAVIVGLLTVLARRGDSTER
jgi:hypothetical protein